MDEHFITKCKITPAVTITAGAAAATAVNGGILDMQGFRSLCIMVTFGAIVTNAVTSFKVTQSDNSDMSSPDDITGSAQTVADDKDDTIFISDHIRPAKRYIRLAVSRATQNATLCAHYIQYDPTEKPVTQPNTVTAVEKFSDAVAGTA